MLGGSTTIRFGRYEVLRPIGEGGMAQVYLGVQRGAGRFEKRLVLKVLHPRLAGSADAVEMFLEEGRVMARLHHPNIVDVYEVDAIEGVPYLALEYVHGPTMGRLYRHVGRPGPDTVGYFVHLMAQVCDGLHYAHTLEVDGRPAGIVHRDVSSQNIVIDAASGMAKLIDFGIAKAVDADKHTEIGILKGRLHYMAPEVIAGVRPDARADLYSVGVMLHRMLLGRMPYRDGDLVSRRQHLTRADLTADDLRSLPEALPEIILKALSPDPAGRYATAADLGADLRAVVEQLGVTQQQIPPFVARVFPRGEEDWQQQDSPEPHSMQWQLPSKRPLWPSLLYGAVLVTLMVVLIVISALTGLLIAALLTRSPAGAQRSGPEPEIVACVQSVDRWR